MQSIAKGESILLQNRFQSRLLVVATLALLAAAILVWAVPAWADNGGPSSIQNGGNRNDRASDSYDGRDLPPKQQKEWATVEEKLIGENTDCMEDCGVGADCQQRCWDVYTFQLDREYRRLQHEAGQ
ncbi:MAG: hypothetical protein RBS34_06585 [Desulfofustis sp.]|jgi:hypothetical protein|nr:hypothetical protein [Desulfofustis sp.]